MTSADQIKILLVEDNPGDARLAGEMLREGGEDRFAITIADRFSSAMERLHGEPFDVVLLDLSLPDAQGVEMVARVQEEVPSVPVVVLSGLNDERVAFEAVQRGAQDYMVKGLGSGEVMARAIRYAIERKREQQLLLREKEKAELANRARTEFLATMSHELRTPLNAIIGFAEVIRQELFGPMEHSTYKQYIDDIHTSGMHLLETINDILDLAKIDAGQAQLNEEHIDVADTVHTSLRMVDQRAADAGVDIDVTISEGLPQLLADKRLVRQILVNLLSNSVKFTPTGGSVMVRAERCTDGALVLSVADTGIGIAASDIPKAMALFGQVDGSLSRKYAGTGLGLPLVKRLVELHGGTMSIDSQVGVGTTVTVRFPSARLIDGAEEGLAPRPLAVATGT